jgi:5-methylcytosine-specific restriction endonuclease McrA
VKDILQALRKAAEDRGAILKDCGGGHFQIRGRLLVNYYPLSRKCSAYVAGTTHGKGHISPKEAVAMAFEQPPIARDDKKGSRSSNSRKKRIALIRRNGNRCHWCQRELTVDTSSIEHIVPLARGGLDNANNRVLACKPCNHGRGHDMPELQS